MKVKPPSAPRQLSFQSKLERLAPGIEYYALTVPENITAALGTRASVPVTACVNGSTPFLVSLYTKGGGRHGLRVRVEVREEVNLKEGDRVRVQITVRDRAAEISLPKDVAGALRAADVLAAFQARPVGQRSFTLRWIDAAAKPETRARRIQAAVEEARAKKKK